MKYDLMAIFYPLQIATEAVIQGVAAAVVIVGLAVLYFDRLSSISHDVGDMADSVEAIEHEVTSVELSSMEKILTKLEYYLDVRGEEAFHSGEDTVYYELERTGLEAGISYVTTHPQAPNSFPDPYTGEVGRDYDGPEVVVEIEFDEQINVAGLFDKINVDEDLAEREMEIFNAEPGLNASSPFEIIIHFPTDDTDTVARFLPEYLDIIDDHLVTIQSEKEDFESVLKDNLQSKQD